MSVQVRRRREAASFLASFVGAQGELLVDTTNNRVQVHDGTTPGGWPAAKLADVIARTAVADATYTALATDRTIAYTALTAARIVNLPAASAYPTGTQLVVVDESGACNATRTITVDAAGSDTINGAGVAIIALGYGFLAIESNGTGKWTIVDQSTASMAQQSASAVAITGGTIDSAAIGATTPSTGRVTTLIATGTATFQSFGYFNASQTYFNAASAGLRVGNLTAAGTPYMDFYSSGVTSGYDVRVIASGGTATAGQGLLQILGSLSVNAGINSTTIGATTASTIKGTTITATTTVTPSADNTLPLGSAAARWSTVYAGTSTINTSDARDKTSVNGLSAAEIAASKDLAAAIGTYRFLAAIAAKGDAIARLHIGMTVQRAVEIMTAHGLEPMAYGFICHDAWDAAPEIPAVPATANSPACREAVLDANGEPTGETRLVFAEIPGSPAIPAVPGRPAGDRYGFRVEELLLFLARGFDARLAALEAK